MTCANCGHSNAEGSIFCARCGSRLTIDCDACGAELPEDARFCPSCGTPVSEARAATTERKLVTVLFADVTGSTGLGERFDPEALARVMGLYFDGMRAEIEAEGGSVEKFIGDAVMAVFGVPNAHEDDPARALQAALRMLDRLNEINKELIEHEGIDLQVRIGVNTGEVLANIDPRPGDPIVTGDMVNAAARLQAAARPGQVLVAERTALATRSFEFDDVGVLELRGKSVPVKAYSLVGRSQVASERGIPGLQAEMVGRDSELELLRTLLHRTSTEARPNLVTIYGPAGVGKSRLTREFLDWAAAADPCPVILRGRCLPYGEGVAYWPLAEILKAAAGIRDSDSSSAALEMVADLGERLLTPEVTADRGWAIAALANTVGLKDPDHSFSGLDPREVRSRTNAAWRSLFTALAGEGPLIAVIEDIHWADPVLLDLLEELTEKVAGPVLIICPARPELTDRRPDWGGGRRSHTSIFLDPLTRAESDALVSALLAIPDLPPDVREEMMAKAEGNPFFLEEIIRHLIDQGRLFREGDSWRATPGLDEVSIPDTVQAVLAARIDLLGADEKRALQMGAVVGRTFWPGPIVGLLDESDESLSDVLDRLEDRELIRSRLGSSMSGEPEYLFKHVLTREVAYETLPRADRGAAHAHVARWIEETIGDRAGELVELIAHHWQEAHRSSLEDPRSTPEAIEDVRKRALEATLGAAEALRGRAAIGRSIGLAEQAVALATDPLERARALTAWGTGALFDFAGDTAWLSLKEAADLLVEHSPEDHRAIARTCARAVETPTRWPGSLKREVPDEVVNRYIDLGMAQLDPGDRSEEMARLLIARAFLVYARQAYDDAGDFEAARSMATRAYEIAIELDNLDLASACLDAAGGTAIAEADLRSNNQISEQRLELLDRITNPWERSDTYAMLAWGSALVGDYARARDEAALGVEAAAEDAPSLVVHNASWLSYAEFWLGNWDRVVGDLAREVKAVIGSKAADPPYFAANHYGPLAFIHGARRDREAAETAGLVRKVVETAVSEQFGPLFRVWHAWIIGRGGEVEAALERLARLDVGSFRTVSEVVRASLLLDSRRFEDVAEVVERAREFARRSGTEVLESHLDRLVGAAGVEGGDPGASLDALAAARAGFAERGMVWEVARTDLWIAEGAIASKQAPAASDALARALPVLERLGSVPEIERARSLLGRL